MPLCRNLFIEALAKESATLNAAFLNHTGTPDSLQTDLSSVDLLINKSSLPAFFLYCKTHDMVKRYTITKQHYQTALLFSFEDGSELKMNLIQNKQNNGLLLLPVTAIFASAVLTPTAFLSPSCEHHYEYILLTCQLDSVPVPDRYKKYFSAMSTEKRVRIFSYLQKKYSLIFNSIDDLYSPDTNIRLQLIIGLRKLKENTLSKILFRFIKVRLFSLTAILRKPLLITATPDTEKKQPPANERESRAAL